MTPLHVELREGRERRGLTLDALHASTRISRDALEAIERGDFDFLPKTYVRLFLRTYATQVGMDPQYVLDRYEEMNKPPGSEVPVSIPKPPPVSWGTVVALSIGFVLLGWAGITMFKNRMGDRYPMVSRGGSPQASQEESLSASASPEGVRPAPEDRVSRSTPPDTVPAAPAALPEPVSDTLSAPASIVGISESDAWWGRDSVVVLQGVCVEQTWLDLSADGQRVFRGEMKPGDARTWTAMDRFYVVSGRSSGIQFAVQGKPLPRAKSWAAEVLRMSITRKGIEVEKKRRAAEAPEDTASQPRSTETDTGSGR